MESATAFNQKNRIAILWVFAVGFLALFFVSSPLLGKETGFHEAMEITGLALVFLAVLGRLWCILFIGARKNEELVTIGPYSMTRNPLYFFSLVGVAGIGLIFGSALLTVSITAACYVVFHYTALREAAFLRSLFPEVYDRYAATTPLFWPNPRIYRSVAERTFSQKALTMTFLDGLFLLALFPLIEGIEYLQASGYLPVLLYLP